MFHGVAVDGSTAYVPGQGEVLEVAGINGPKASFIMGKSVIFYYSSKVFRYI